MQKIYLFVFISMLSCLYSQTNSNNNYHAQVVVYGGTSAGVIAAVKAAKLGNSVLLISPDTHLGGMSSSGLGFTDSGNTHLIGGLAKEFFQRIYKKYQSEDNWQWQKKSNFKNKAQSNLAINKDDKTMWVFEPHIAEAVFEDLITENNIQVIKNEWIDRTIHLNKEGTKIISFQTLSGKIISGTVFIDTSYEGDLMALAGVSYHVGRESNDVYHEKYNGVQKNIFQHNHNFHKYKIDPYVIKGDQNSGLLPNIFPNILEENCDGDHKIEAYCFRLCLTKNLENKIPFTKPQNYNPLEYELLIRLYESGWKETFKKFDNIPNLKTDCNNHGPLSFDYIGKNYNYPEASYAERKKIIKEHETYQKGWLYFIANDPRVPKKIKKEMQKWGYAKDEFKDNNGFPYQLYVREARRMIGEFVMTENEVMHKKEVTESIGIGSYHLDSHNTQRYVNENGHVENEGDIGVRPPAAYKINKGTILPKKTECTNLIVPVCVSSSHIAYGSIRMEPVFMILSESAAQIANIALSSKCAVQDVPYESLKQELINSGQILEN